MSIDQPDLIDAIGLETDSGKVVLTVSDHLDWNEEQAHLVALQEKMKAYLRYVESGELFSAYPEAVGRITVIDIVTRVEMPGVGTTFLEQVRRTLDPAEIELRTRVLQQ